MPKKKELTAEPELKTTKGKTAKATPAPKKTAPKAATAPKAPKSKEASKPAPAVQPQEALVPKKPAARKKTAARTAASPEIETHTPFASAPPIYEVTHEMISVRAYFLSEHRKANGQPSHPETDWIEAERQLLAEIEGVSGHSGL